MDQEALNQQAARRAEEAAKEVVAAREQEKGTPEDEAAARKAELADLAKEVEKTAAKQAERADLAQEVEAGIAERAVADADKAQAPVAPVAPAAPAAPETPAVPPEVKGAGIASAFAGVTGWIKDVFGKMKGAFSGFIDKLYGWLGIEKKEKKKEIDLSEFDKKFEFDGSNPIAPILWPKKHADWDTVFDLSSDIQTSRKLEGEKARPHKGVDVAFPEGTPLKWSDIGEGKVLNDPTQLSKTAGYYVDIQVGEKVYRFLHLKENSIELRQGDKVVSGQLLGRTGATGDRRNGSKMAAHLHFEVRELGEGKYPYGEALDPYSYLPDYLQKKAIVKREGKTDKFWQHGGDNQTAIV